MKIEVNTSQLVEKSNDIKILKTDLLNIMEEIEILVLSVESGWQGDAEKMFAAKILYVKEQFNNIAMFFDDYADLLKTFAYTYEQQDDDLASKINLT